jgi:hypothetical protein
VSGATSKPLWLSYVPPNYLIQERRNVVCWYEIRSPELDWELGIVERYRLPSGQHRWRTLDHWKCDWRDGFKSREEAAQDLVQNCPRTVERIAARRRSLAERSTLTESK